MEIMQIHNLQQRMLEHGIILLSAKTHVVFNGSLLNTRFERFKRKIKQAGCDDPLEISYLDLERRIPSDILYRVLGWDGGFYDVTSFARIRAFRGVVTPGNQFYAQLHTLPFIATSSYPRCDITLGHFGGTTIRFVASPSCAGAFVASAPYHRRSIIMQISHFASRMDVYRAFTIHVRPDGRISWLSSSFPRSQSTDIIADMSTYHRMSLRAPIVANVCNMPNPPPESSRDALLTKWVCWMSVMKKINMHVPKDIAMLVFDLVVRLDEVEAVSIIMSRICGKDDSVLFGLKTHETLRRAGRQLGLFNRDLSDKNSWLLSEISATTAAFEPTPVA